jgi:protein-disulfide isomerase
MRLLIVAAMSALGATAASAQPPSPAAALTAAQRQEVLAILREALRADPTILADALRANPLILRGAIEALREAELRDRDSASRAAIAENAETLFRDAADPYRGNPNGTIVLVEFFDVRCPYCRQLHLTMQDLVRRQRDVRVVLKGLPVLGPTSLLASRALLAAQRQGKYDALHDALLRLREDTTEPVLRREAERLGLDWPRLRREMDDPAIQRRLDANRRLAEALRVEGTPAVVFGESLLPGAVDLPTLERLAGEHRDRARRGG